MRMASTVTETPLTVMLEPASTLYCLGLELAAAGGLVGVVALDRVLLVLLDLDDHVLVGLDLEVLLGVLVDLLVGEQGERSVAVLQQIGAGLVLAVEDRADDDRAARVAVLEADDRPPRRPAGASAGRARCPRWASRSGPRRTPRSPLRLGYFTRTRPMLLAGRCCWSPRRPRAKPTSRAPAGGRISSSSVRDGAAGDLEVRSGSRSRRGSCASRT